MSEHQNTSQKSRRKDTLSVDQMQRHLAVSAKELKHKAFVGLSHEVVMTNLLEQIGPVDFRAKANIESSDNEAKLKTRHHLIITVEEILEKARANHWGLCRNNRFIYAYNGSFWKIIEESDLKRFLKQAAERMGLDRFTARYVGFVRQLYDQFVESAYLPTPKANRETVKINLSNGTFEIGLHGQHLRAPDAADFLTHQLPFAYDPSAQAPLFRTFLDRVLPDPDSQKLLAEYLGYIFVSPAKLKLEKTLLLYGSGANGKSVFFEIVIALLGKDNVSNYSLQNLTNEPAYCRAHLANKLVNYASEINGKLESDTFKQLASGEPIEARPIYGEPFTITDYAKLIFNCNELPADVEHTNAYFRRFLIIPFNVTIPDHEQDKQLAAKIIGAELSGVFNWVLDGLRQLLEQGRFTDCEAVNQQVDIYRRQSDSVRLFLDENEYKPDVDSYTTLKELYREYKVFCSEDGYRAVNNRNFKKRLESNGLQTTKRNIGQVVFVIKADSSF